MHWPGATAAETCGAGFEAVSVSEEGGSGAGPPAPPAAGPAPPARLNDVASRSGPDLPCMADPDLFFAELPDDVERAKSHCRSCPVRIACLSGARERREPWGVWGGELFLRGQVVPRKRPRGRPRKSEVAA